MRKIIFATIVFATCIPIVCSAQSSKVIVDKNLVYQQTKTPELVDNHNYTAYFTAGKEVFNLKNIPISRVGGEIIDFKVNPTGVSYAVLSGKKNKFSLTTFRANSQNGELAKIEDLSSPSAIAYNPDGRFIYIANGNRMEKRSSATLEINRSFGISPAPKSIMTDGEGKFVVCLYPNKVEVYNEETGLTRSSLYFPATVAAAAFSNDGDKLIVACEDGTVETYSTRDFSKLKSYSDLGTPTSLSVHPDDKFIAMSVDGNKVQFLNLMDDLDRPSLIDSRGPHHFARFATDIKKDAYLIFDGDNALIYKRLSGFAPNYTSMLRDQLNEKMREWMKMRPMETEEEYRQRVNAESIERQRQLFANEIATSLAGDLLSHSPVSLGNYNPQNGLLTIIIGSLPPIFVKVPQEDMAGFGNGTNLQFSNAVYGLTPTDSFELIYLDIFNPTNSKKYSFDNLDREDLGLLLTDDSFVSLDLIMKSNREDVLLKGIKDRIVEEAKAKNLITDHTDINVDTRIVPSFDADGKSINNYRVAFSYKVDPGYSEKEDFPSGKYRIADSNAAQSLLGIIAQAFESEFAPYIEMGKKLTVEITGSADGAPIRSALPYDGSLGIFEDEPVRINSQLNTISVSQSGISKNEQLAFMRGQSVKNEMLRRLPQLNSMKTDYKYNIELSESRGGEFRRVNVIMTFIDIN